MNTFVAEFITEKQFAYKCPYCWTKYNFDGRPRKNAKNRYHYHGSNGCLENRIEERSSHCEIVKGNIKILIDDSTIKK